MNCLLSRLFSKFLNHSAASKIDFFVTSLIFRPLIFTHKSIEDAKKWFDKLPNYLDEKQNKIAQHILKEINERLNFLLNVGLDYLTLSRESGTLSGGEAQRIRLASQIGSGLTGVLYVLDEPSILSLIHI